METRQTHPLQENPNQLNLVLVGTYTRTVAASGERVWENVRDWAHLPWLHDTSFDYAALDAEGDWGWRTWSAADHSAQVELVVDDAQQRYVARSYKGDAQISEIWTRVTPAGDSCDIDVRFFVPDVDDADVERVGSFFSTLYTRLWDEDEAMMQTRQAKLDQQRHLRQHPAPEQVDLGPIDRLAARLPLTVQIGRHTFRVSQGESDYSITPTTCPHLLGPLATHTAAGELTCPWHGYRFNLASGACVFPANAQCRLPRQPTLRNQAGIAVLGYFTDPEAPGGIEVSD